MEIAETASTQIEKKISYKMGKSEKLRHKSLVDKLFAEGKTIYEYPLRVTVRTLTAEELAGSFRTEVPARIGNMQMLITVPKKKLRHAVDRVRMRRLIRESYRLNRHILREEIENRPEIATLSMAFIYLDKNLSDYATIERKMIKILRKIAGKI